MTRKEQLRKDWKNLFTTKTATRYHVAQYAIMRAILVESNADKYEIAKALLFKCFTPTSNKNKLDKGWTTWKALELALDYLNCANNYPQFYKDLKWMNFNLTKEEDILYKNIVKNLLKEVCENPFDFGKLWISYLITRQDISPEYQLVQTAHVASVLGQAVNKEKTDMSSTTFVILGVPDKYELGNMVIKIRENGYSCVSFFEPDIGNELTSIAILPQFMNKYERRNHFLAKNKLLTFAQ